MNFYFFSNRQESRYRYVRFYEQRPPRCTKYTIFLLTMVLLHQPEYIYIMQSPCCSNSDIDHITNNGLYQWRSKGFLMGGANSDGGTKPYNFYFAQISYSKSQKVFLMGDMVGRTLHHVPPLATPLAIATSSPFRYALSLHWGQLPPPNKHEKYTFLMLCVFFYWRTSTPTLENHGYATGLGR